jgi:hypothetical protein
VRGGAAVPATRPPETRDVCIPANGVRGRMALGVHDEMTDEIARELQAEGTCVRVVSPIPRQRVVDVSWAAKRAGRLIGQHVRTSVTPLTERPDGEVAIVVILEQDPARARVPHQRIS